MALSLALTRCWRWKATRLDKPKSTSLKRAQHLLRLRGRTHELLTAAVVAREGAIIWRHVDTPKLKMRAFSDAFLDDYLARAGDATLHSVGAYQLEGLGAQLFERVEGDYFSVLGLPLLPLLAFLREHGIAQAMSITAATKVSRYHRRSSRALFVAM